VTAAISFLDVGQGHAAVLTSAGSAAVVDCPHQGGAAVITRLASEGFGAVEAIFVTHRDLDHCAGVPDLLEQLEVGVVYLNFAWALPPQSTARTRVKAVLSSIFSKAERDAVPIERVYAGANGVIGHATWTALAPTVYDTGRATLNDATNRASLVIMFSLGERRFLILGDADRVTIANLLNAWADLHADAVLVSHHGAKIANTAALLDRVDPAFGVISVGRLNGYGHPHADTLRELSQRQNCRVMCTQVNALCEPNAVVDAACAGTITFYVDEHGDVTVTPSVAAHSVTVAGWTAPRCVVT
jgi:competence protein ComEC